jgi:hypothetical protein
MKEKTYVDSGAPFTAFWGLEQDAEDAFRILDDPDRELVPSIRMTQQFWESYR